MNELLFDLIKGEIIEARHNVMKEVLLEKQREYIDNYFYTLGRDFFYGTTVWFIRDNLDHNEDFGRMYLEDKVLDYLGDK